MSELLVQLHDRQTNQIHNALLSQVEYLLVRNKHYEVVDPKAYRRLTRAIRQEADNGALVAPMEELGKPGPPELPMEVRSFSESAEEDGKSLMHIGMSRAEEDAVSGDDRISVRVVPIRHRRMR